MMRRLFPVCLLVLACVAGCSTFTVTISIAPTSATVQVNGTQQFTATVTGVTNTAVFWEVNGIIGGNATAGTISFTGLYTAPAVVPSPPTVTITAVAQADPNKTASATVTITGIAVSVAPATASVPVGLSQQFTATVLNDPSNKGVTWTLTQGGTACSPGCGTIAPTSTASGAPTTYTAPAAVPTPNTVTLRATSVADTSKSGSATITVLPPVAVGVAPAAASVPGGTTQSFTATVTNDPNNKGVTWAVTGAGCAGAACGSVSPTSTASGVATTYTAPVTVPTPNTVTVKATSVADPTKSASAMVTVLPPPPISVSVSPTTATVVVNATQSFTATVNFDFANKGVTWTVTGAGCAGATCGTVLPASTPSGVATTYTAPGAVPTPATVIVTATSVADPTKSASATVTITAAPPIAVSVAPPTASVPVNGTQTFTATLTNDTGNKGVTWTLSGAGCAGAACGTVSPTSTTSGVATTYTAPAAVPTPATVTITATSVADPTKTASATITITPASAITVSIVPTSPSVAVNLPQLFAATVMNDASNKGVTWTLTAGAAPCPGTGCGTLSPTSTPSGPPTLYTAPGAVPTPATVTITATSVADTTKSASTTITIVASNANNAKVKGNYAFLANGFNGSGAFAVAGSFVADGIGSLTSGVVDFNGAGALPASAPITSGAYNLGPDNRGTLTITTAGAANAFIGQFAFDPTTGNGRVIEFDATSSTGGRSSGFFKKQDPTAFTASAFSGDYAFGFSGAHFSGGRFGLAGRLTADGVSAITNGLLDSDDAGMVNAGTGLPGLPFTGSFTAPSATTGRATQTLTIAGGAITVHLAFYVISASDALVIDTDPFIATASLFSGEALKQSGPFSNSSLNGISVVSLTGLAGTGADVSVGLLTFTSGSASFTLVQDENKAGVVSTGTTISGTFSVSSSPGIGGRVTITAGGKPPVAYLVTTNEGFLVGTDGAVITGFFEPQAAGPFTASSISGPFVIGTLFPAETNVGAISGVITSDGVSALSGTVDNTFSASPFLSFDQAVAATYTVASDGSGTVTITSAGGATARLRIVNSKKVVAIDTSSAHPQLIIIGF